jgi:cellulose synthase operon protein C
MITNDAKLTAKTFLLIAIFTCGALSASSSATAQNTAKRERTKADDKADEDAARARKEREKRVPTVVKEKAREKVEIKDRPSLSLQDFARRKIELQVAKKRQELILFLDQILAQNPSKDEEPELLFQKAELFLEESQFHFFEGMEIEDAITEAEVAGNATKMRALKKAKKRELDASKTWLEDSILLFEEIASDFLDFERMPEVLYSLGRSYWDKGEYKKALPVYRRIVKEHKDSQYVADSWLAFGEYYFEAAPDEEKDLDKALDAYKKAGENEDSPIFGYAVYKQGWCFYNLGEYETASEKFKEVIFYSDLNSDMLGDRRIQLSREARKDYVLAYSHFGNGREAKAEFESVAPEFEERRTMLERLANIYYGDGKDRDAIIVYRVLMSEKPDSTRNPLFQAKIVKLASRIGEKRQVVAQARKLTEEYLKVKKMVKEMNQSGPKYETAKEDLESADEVADNTLRFLATTWHNEAKKTRDEETFEYAHELYGDFLHLFAHRKAAYEIRFFYAELLFRLEKFQLAGEQYIQVYKKDPKGKWAEAASEEAVRAYDEVMNDFDRLQPSQPETESTGIKPKKLPAVKKKYIGVCNNYIKNFPDGVIVIEAKYKVARVLYEHNYFSQAVERFEDIIETHSNHMRAVQAANLILDSYNIQEDWQNLHDSARSFAAKRFLRKDAEFQENILTILEESSFKLISDFEKEKDFEAAAIRYLAFADEFSNSRLADKGLANAAAMFTLAGQLDRAVKVRVKLVENYPSSALVPDQIYAIATSYEQVVDYKSAANWLENFAGRYPKDDRAQDALYNASIYRQGMGQTKQAVQNKEKYLKNYPKVADAVEVAYSIPVAWEQAGKTSQALKAYLEFVKYAWKKAPARAVNAQYKVVRILEKKKRKKKEFEKQRKMLVGWITRYKRAKQNLADIADPLAYLEFEKAELVFQDFKRIKLALPDDPKKFRDSLIEKRKAKKGVDAAYTSVVQLGSPEWAIASLYMIGASDQHLVDAIQAVPSPRKLDEEQRMLFRDKLAEQTLPIEEKVTQAMVLCLDESTRFGVFNSWTRKCSRYLEDMRPDSYPKLEFEKSVDLNIAIRIPESGKGLVYELPKKGGRAVSQKDAAPPAAKLNGETTLDFSIPSLKEPEEAEVEDVEEQEEFDFGEDEAS